MLYEYWEAIERFPLDLVYFVYGPANSGKMGDMVVLRSWLTRGYGEREALLDPVSGEVRVHKGEVDREGS